ncbi:MAG: VCBS repeat-containing protein [Planctomycetes bacterium]|nr:VCBS repeat-containing protein [Planctomycetota bacterium]
MPSRRWFPCILLVVVLLRAAPAADGPGGPAFRTNRFEFSGAVREVLARDIDGDRRMELIVQQKSALEVYRPGPRGYSAAHSISVMLPKETFLWTFADVDGAPGDDLVCMTPDGVVCLPQKEGAFPGPAGVVIETPTVFTGLLTDPPLEKEFSTDLDGDGDADLILPIRRAFALYAQTAPGKFTLRQSIPAEMDIGVDVGGWGVQTPATQSVALPRFQLGDYTGDGRTDLLFVGSAPWRVFAQAADGSFPAAPEAAVLAGAPGRKKRNRQFDWPVPPEVDDVNGDRIADIIYSDAGNGTTTLFLGKTGGADLAQPSDVKRFDGWVLSHDLVDLDGDGRKDLILVRVPKLGIGEALQILLTRTVDLDIAIFLNQPDGTFGAQPAHRRTIEVPLVLSISNTAIKVESPYIINFTGDFTRDGRKDLMVKTADDEISIFFGGAGKDLFTSKPGATLKTIDTLTFTSTAVTVDDLNADGVSDVILHHRDIADQAHVVEVFLSK